MHTPHPSSQFTSSRDLCAIPDLPVCTDQPLKTLLEPLHLQNPLARELPRTFIWCCGDKDLADVVRTLLAELAARARADPKWRYYELPTGHLPWLTMPEATAQVLLQIAGLAAQ